MRRTDDAAMLRRIIAEALFDTPSFMCRSVLIELMMAYEAQRAAQPTALLSGEDIIAILHPAPPGEATDDAPGEHAIQLAPAGPVLGIASNVANANAAATLYRMPVWAMAVEIDGSQHFKDVRLPAVVTQLVIFADNTLASQRAADAAVRAHQQRGIACSVIFPTEQFGDFNTMLMEGSPC